jgi:hypothetical protein
MKRILLIVVGLGLASGLAFAQGGAGSGSSTGGSGAEWGGDHSGQGTAPQAWNNKYQHTYSGSQAAGTQTQDRVGKPVPADVKAIVQKFQQDRTRLMAQLRTCSDEQRQQILQQMEQARQQLRDQLCQLREQAQQQAEQMRNRFGNTRERMLNQGAGTAGTGRDR